MIRDLEQILTRLAMPSGLVWLGLAALVVAAWRMRRGKSLATALLLFVIYTLAGNAWVSAAAMYLLERPYRDVDSSLAASYDAVVILGGGAEDGPTGRPQLAPMGDRVMLGARLYHQGQAGALVCTGTGKRLRPGERDTSEAAAALLVELGIPRDQIVRIGGRYTKEEMQQLQRLMDQRQWRRVGLVTSAWHMRRAMRLAESEELVLEPLPADYRSKFPSWSPVQLIPNSKSFHDTSVAFKELLAEFVRR